MMNSEKDNIIVSEDNTLDWGVEDFVSKKIKKKTNIKERPPDERLSIEDKGTVTARELFIFAKWALIIIASMFTAIAAIKIILPINKGADTVWSYASVALNTIVSLLFGYYFGAESKTDPGKK